jgi:hypothetical protein
MLVALNTSILLASPNATITVTSINDNGIGSLRQAITDAQPGDTIDFSANLSNQTITLTNELAIDKDLTINSSIPISLSGNHTTRIFNIFTGNINTAGVELNVKKSYLS